MAFGFSRTRVSPIAIDFGSDRLKLLQLIPGNPPQLVAAAAARVPDAARGDAAARHAFFSQALPELMKKQPFKGRRAICSLPAYQTLVQNLEVSRADHAGLEELVADQLRQRMNVDPGRMVIRHHPLGQVVRNGTNMQHVLCMAASRDVVMQYLKLCSDNRIDLVGMHGEPMAVLRAFANPETDESGQVICYIDIGASSTKWVIAHGGAVQFAKTVHVAGDHLAPLQQAAEAHAQVEANAASSHVRQTQDGGQGAETGLAMLNATGGAASGDSQDQGETVEYLIDELQMSLRYHQSLFPKKPIEKLVFLGGGARQVQTCQRIARAVRIAAQLGDPLARVARISAAKPPVGVDLNEPQPGWSVPFGLCHSEANL